MDRLTDQQIESIYDRLTKYINTSDLKGKKRSEIIEALDARIGRIKTPEKSGDPSNLIKAGFSDRALDVPGIKSELQPVPDVVVVQERLVKVPVRVLARRVVSINRAVPSGVPVRFFRQKVAVRVRGRVRNYSKKTINVTLSSWKGKRAYYVYSTREKKLKTWGLIKDEGN